MAILLVRWKYRLTKWKSLFWVWILLCISSPTYSSLDCSKEQNWQHNNVTNGMFCVENSTKLTFQEASDKCSGMTSHLLTINSSSEQTIIQDAVSSHIYFIGANDKTTEGVYQWLDSGETLTYTNWRAGEPDGYKNADCVMLVGTTGLWADVRCDRTLRFICEREASRLDCSNEQNWRRNKVTNGVFCIENSVELTFQEASDKCSGMTSHLLTINSSAEQIVIQDNILSDSDAVSSHGYFIGANDKTTEGLWQWLDSDETLTYDNWMAGEPNGFNREDCVVLDGTTGLWYDLSCDIKMRFICKREEDVSGSTTATPLSLTTTQSQETTIESTTPIITTELTTPGEISQTSTTHVCKTEVNKSVERRQLSQKAGNCRCRCKLFMGKRHLNITANVLSTIMDKTRKELTVDKRITSKYIRTKVSAEDSHVSSQIMGLFGVTTMTLMLLCIVLPDLLSCLVYVYSKLARLHRQQRIIPL